MRPGWPDCGSALVRDAYGMVVLLTFRTGIGSALFVDGNWCPNTELVHLPVAASRP